MRDNIPLFTRANGDNFEVSDSVFITASHIKKSIIRIYPEVCDQYLMRRYWRSGEVVKIYAWNSIIDVLNKRGVAWIVLNDILKDC